MTEQTQHEDYFAETKQKIEQHIQDRILLFKLHTTKRVSKLIAGLFTGLILFFIILFVLLFVSILAGYYFANLMHNTYYGFGIILAIYLLLFFIIVQFRKTIIERKVINIIIKILFDK